MVWHVDGSLDVNQSDPRCKRCRHHKSWHNQTCVFMFNGDVLPEFCACPAYAKDNLEWVEQEAFFKGIK